MAFVVETGTGLATANSLVSVEYADEYFADRENTTWSSWTESKKRSRLVIGTAYANTQYKYKGERLNPDQGTAFPRTGILDPAGRSVAGIPDCVKQVVCELALRADSGTLIPDPTMDEGGRPIKMKQMRIGPMQRIIEFAGPGEIVELARFPAVDALMCAWLITPQVVLANGVKIAEARVSGVSNNNMTDTAVNADRYSGPINENQKETGETNGTLPI